MDGAPAAEKCEKRLVFLFWREARGVRGAGRGATREGGAQRTCKKRHKKVREISRSPKSFFRRPAGILLQDRGANPVDLSYVLAIK